MNSPVWPRRKRFVERTNGNVIQSSRSNLSYDAGLMTGNLVLRVFDCAGVLGAAALSTTVYTYGIDGVVDIAESELASWVAAVLAPFVLYDKRFVTFAMRDKVWNLLCPFAVRFTLFAAIVATLGALTQTLDDLPFAWLVIWFVTSLMLTLLSRILVAKAVRVLQRRGTISEVIAVVGAGPIADRLVQALRQSGPGTVELLGIFDDRYARADASLTPIGNLAQLIELGKARRIDWILLALPSSAEQRLFALVKRLMSLSVPIGLCAQHVGSTLPYRIVAYAANTVPVCLLYDRPIKRWDAFIRTAEDVLPRWMITFAVLPLTALAEMIGKQLGTSPRSTLQSFQHERAGSFVTPNAEVTIPGNEGEVLRTVDAGAD